MSAIQGAGVGDWRVTVAIIMLVSATGGCTAERNSASPPDVLLVVLDTVRRDHVAPCNPPSELTPQLSSIAERGTSFCNMVTPGSWTLPVHGSIFTGRLPREHGADFVERSAARVNLGTLSINPLKAEVGTLAEHFVEAGYRTILVSENPVLDPGTGLIRGFQVARIGRSFGHEPDDSAVVALRSLIAEDDPGDQTPRFIVVNLSAAHEPYLTADGKSINLFDDAAGKSLFQRYVTGAMEENEREQFLARARAAYARGVRRADADLGAVLELLRKAEWIGDDSLIAVTSDHGEHLGEFGLLDHGRSVHRVNSDVFAVVKLPSNRRVAGPVERLVQSQDLFPTLLRWAGLPVPAMPHARDLFSGSEGRLAITTSEPDGAWQRLSEGRLGSDFLLSVQRGEERLVRINGTRDIGQSVPGILPVEGRAEAPPELVRAADELFLPTIDAQATPVVIDEERRKALQSVGYLD